LFLFFLSKLKVIEESKTIITNTIICSVCGGAGHISSDCKLKYLTAEKPLTWQEREKMDTEVTFLAVFF
jgi:splicing factor 1